MKWLFIPRDLSMYLTPIEVAVIAACIGLAIQLYLQAQTYREIRELVHLHRINY